MSNNDNGHRDVTVQSPQPIFDADAVFQREYAAALDFQAQCHGEAWKTLEAHFTRDLLLALAPTLLPLVVQQAQQDAAGAVMQRQQEWLMQRQQDLMEQQLLQVQQQRFERPANPW